MCLIPCCTTEHAYFEGSTLLLVAVGSGETIGFTLLVPNLLQTASLFIEILQIKLNVWYDIGIRSEDILNLQSKLIASVETKVYQSGVRIGAGSSLTERYQVNTALQLKAEARMALPSLDISTPDVYIVYGREIVLL